MSSCGSLPIFSAVFTRHEPLTGITEFDYFRDSYQKFKQESEEWLLENLKNRHRVKNDKTSEYFRTEGNYAFQRTDYFNSLRCYSRSVRFANRDGVNYGLALANRSATLYYLGDFENCLKDIEFCLKSAYPKKLYPKILLRKCYCLYRLKGENSSDLKNCVESALTFIKNCEELSQKDKDKHEKQFKNLDFNKVPTSPQILKNSDMEIPAITNGENENFASASSSIGIRYEEKKGRHVVATKNIKRGDVLFVEKAFAFGNLTQYKCYYCLKDAKASIPCPTCSVWVFCNEDCFQKSWQTFHKYECLAVQTDIYYRFFATFIALKTICLGKSSRFAEVKSDEITQFGSKEDNYPYFNSLLSHWRYCSSLENISKSATKMITYLQQSTTFFDELPPGIDVNYIGGLLIRHLCQLQCNSLIADHYRDQLLERPPCPMQTQKSTITIAIFPSVALMNHSCLPNVNIYYVEDTAIVKAVKDINESDEVLHCYGFNYLRFNWMVRNKICAEAYNFTCTCSICAGPIGDYVDNDLYKCPHCQLWRFNDKLLAEGIMNCLRCGGSLCDFAYFANKVLNPLIISSLYNLVLRMDILLITKEQGEMIFTKLNPFYAMLYEAFWKHYIYLYGDFKIAIKYINKYVKNETEIYGECMVAVTLLRALKLIHRVAREKNLNLRSDEIKINLLKEKCATVLQLYYPFKRSALYDYMTT